MNPSSNINVEQSKFILDGLANEDARAALPKGYGDNRLVIMARDPFWFFAYWEITAERLSQILQNYEPDIWQQCEVVLRVYDVTDIEFNGMNAHRFFNVGVHFDSGQWYVKVDESGRSYIVDLGLQHRDGRFISFLRSNRITMPMGRISDKTDMEFVAVKHGTIEWDKVLEASGAGTVGQGSAEVVKAMAQRWEFLKSVFSGSSSQWTPPSSSAPSSGSSRK